MAEKGLQPNLEILSCSICLDLLVNPVTIPCGHSYCEKCIKTHWSKEEKKSCSCPQCRKTFTQRPDLVRNTVLAALAEQLKKPEPQAAPADLCYAGPEDVACDVCSERKVKALKSCLGCLVSYCGTHLQPHYESPAFKKHKLVEPCKTLQENLCPRHDEVMKMFCRTDQQLICYLCSVDEHKGHDTVSAASEREKKQQELDKHQKNLQQRIQDQDKDLKLLQQEVEAINGSADKAVKDSEEIFTQLIRLMEQRRSEVKQQIRSQQKTEVSRVKELQEKLEQEMAELKRSHAELMKLPLTEDHNQFLHSYSSLSALTESRSRSSIQIRPLRHFEDVTAAVSELRDQLQDVLMKKHTNTVQRANVSPPQSEPKTRAEFLKFSCDLSLDRNTVHDRLVLSLGNRRATTWRKRQSYPSHPDRFTSLSQVLSKQSLPGRCYFEVDCGKGVVAVAVAYKSISREGWSDDCAFGQNDKSWVISFDVNSCVFKHKHASTAVPYPPSSRIGVYLDHRAGLLSFYSVSQTMTLLHRVQTRFTEPLYAGLGVFEDDLGNGGSITIR